MSRTLTKWGGGGKRIFSLTTFGCTGAYILYCLNFLHARYACSGWNCHWLTFTMFRLPRFAETVDTISIPPHSEVILWAKLKTNNGRRGPTAGVVLALQTFVQEFRLLVGRSLVRADADDWKVPILLCNSDPLLHGSNAAGSFHIHLLTVFLRPNLI